MDQRFGNLRPKIRGLSTMKHTLLWGCCAVVVVEWESTEGLRGVDKCLVAVGPP